jgi:hypothetical protein
LHLFAPFESFKENDSGSSQDRLCQIINQRLRALRLRKRNSLTRATASLLLFLPHVSNARE